MDESGRKLTPKEVCAYRLLHNCSSKWLKLLPIICLLFFLHAGFSTAIPSFPWQRVWKDEDWEKNEETGGGGGTFFQPPTKQFGHESVVILSAIIRSCQNTMWIQLWCTSRLIHADWNLGLTLQLLKKMSSSDTPLGTVALLQEKQKSQKTPYIVLSGSGKSMNAWVISVFQLV